MLSEQIFRLFGNFHKNFGVIFDFLHNEGTKACINSYWKMPLKSIFGHFDSKRAKQKD